MEETTSRTEKSYIEASCKYNVRADGRERLDARCISLELDVLPQCNSSCRLSLGTGTDLICSIKLEVSEPGVAAPKDGILDVSVDFSPVINLRSDKRRLQEYGSKIAGQLQDTLIATSAVELSKLCIIPNKVCWVLHLDILFFQLDGCPVDAASYAAFAALHTARYPKIELIEGESGKPEDFELSSDIASAMKLPLSVDGVPVIVTIAEIGSSIVVDCDSTELACANSLASLAFDGSGACCGIKREGQTGFLMSSGMNEAIAISGSLAKSIISHLHNTVESVDIKRDSYLLHPEVAITAAGLLI